MDDFGDGYPVCWGNDSFIYLMTKESSVTLYDQWRYLRYPYSYHVQPKEKIMRLSPPTKTTFWLSVLFALLGIIGRYLDLPILSDYYFYSILLAYIVLFFGTVLKNF